MGALVVFEPCGVSHRGLFQEACAIAHVIKYSHERLEDIPAELDHSRLLRLQIETLGEQGLRYRWRSKKGLNEWISSEAIALNKVADTAGAGDWTTAGIIAKTAAGGLAAFDKLSHASINEAIRFGQALGAWACQFEGARGGMYAIDKRSFHAQVKHILEGEERAAGTVVKLKSAKSKASSLLCATCGPVAKKKKRTKSA
jgi:fructokinase